MAIRVLPQTLINQIAAGEVVVGLGSVVKELVENSIDAGAGRIEVLLGADGLDVEVRDDGIGMNREDAELCLQRHATSKIRSLEDLLALQTRGFRGEAMPSIASVSRMEILTRQARSDSGTRVVVEGGRIQRIEPAGCPVGTRVIVRDLFYNTPARRKFLKSATAEINNAMRTITRQAMAQPAIAFRVERGGRETLELPAGQPLADRFLSLMGSQVRDRHLLLAHEREGVRVHGVLAHPNDARGDRRSQFFFVNDRPFTNRALQSALEQACRGFVMAGKYPVACVFVEVPPGAVDFNVHPTKEEVRFQDERDVAGAVFRAAEAALQGSPALIGEVQLPPRAPSPAEAAAGAPPPFQLVQPAFVHSPDALIRRAFERKGGEPARQPDWVQEADRLRAAATPALPPPTTPARMPPLTARPDGAAIFAGPGERPDDGVWAGRADPEPLGQIALTYIIARHGDDLLIIDQHAVHERLVYLRLRRRRRAAESQSLLIPITLEVGPAQHELLRAHAETFAEAGIGLHEFGPRTWAIDSLPAELGTFDPVPIVLESLDDLAEAGRLGALEELRDRLLIRTACHAAIRAGELLDHARMCELLRMIREERLSFTCPHGRPTIVRLSRHELERQFKRVT